MIHMRSLPKMMGLASGLLLLVACGTPQSTPTLNPVPSSSTATLSPAALLLGHIKGVLVDKDTGKPSLAGPGLFRDQLETETEAELAEIQEYMDKIELEIDSQGTFLFTGVPPGQYVVFTTQHGVVTSAFTVLPGQVVDLGEIEVPR